MAKNMARIENGVVVNLEWRSDNTAETDNLKNISERMVAIGDLYKNGKYYRDEAEVLTPYEALEQERNKLLAEMQDMQEALNLLGVNA